LFCYWDYAVSPITIIPDFVPVIGKVDNVLALVLALEVGEYPALSGQRLRSEHALVMNEAEPSRALVLLLGWGAFRLWDPS
jgi:uncharacterized membrane protein YkvA (DUF1232 family)